ncbi:hypothetical protein SPONN_2512 [uncultured Candidatus Thioglobus sp.]|nr:hypothetical protein SPONN_2512 [uncultured Candidatus Thioglobus sp.]
MQRSLGEGKNPSERHLLDLAKKHSIKNAQKIIDEVKIAVKCFTNYAKEFDISKQSFDLIMQGIMDNE